MEMDFEVKKTILEKVLPSLMCISCNIPPRPDENGRSRYICTKCESTLCDKCFQERSSRHKKSIFEPKPKLFCGIPFGTKCDGKFCLKPSKIIFNMLQDLHFACKYRHFGCFEICKKEELEYHESNCKFRLVHCVQGDCDEKVSLSRLFDHLQNHSIMTCQLDNSGSHQGTFHHFDSKNISFKTIKFVSKEGVQFFKSGFVKDAIFRYWIYVLETPKSASTFSFKYIIQSDKSGEVSYSGDVVSIDVSKEDIISNDLYFDMSLEKRLKFNGAKYSLTISKQYANTKDIVVSHEESEENITFVQDQGTAIEAQKQGNEDESKSEEYQENDRKENDQEIDDKMYGKKIVTENNDDAKDIDKRHSGNPFGTPRNSSEKHMEDTNPFGEDYDESMNPFSDSE